MSDNWNEIRSKWLDLLAGEVKRGNMSHSIMAIGWTLSGYINRKSRIAWAAQETMAEDLAMKEDTVQKGLSTLRRCGYIAVKHRRRGSNQYTLILPANGWRENVANELKRAGKGTSPDSQAPDLNPVQGLSQAPDLNPGAVRIVIRPILLNDISDPLLYTSVVEPMEPKRLRDGWKSAKAKLEAQEKLAGVCGSVEGTAQLDAVDPAEGVT